MITGGCCKTSDSDTGTATLAKQVVSLEHSDLQLEEDVRVARPSDSLHQLLLHLETRLIRDQAVSTVQDAQDFAHLHLATFPPLGKYLEPKTVLGKAASDPTFTRFLGPHQLLDGHHPRCDTLGKIGSCRRRIFMS